MRIQRKKQERLLFWVIWYKYKQFCWDLHLVKTTKWKRNWESESKNYQSRDSLRGSAKKWSFILGHLFQASHSKGNLIMPMDSACFRMAQRRTKISEGQNHTTETWGCYCYGSPDFPHDCKDPVKDYSQSKASGVARFQNLTCWSPNPAFLKNLMLKNTEKIFLLILLFTEL